jgi:hypothetical protein
MYFPPKTKANHYFTPPFLLPLTNPLCMVVCQPPLVGFRGSTTSSLNMGGKYQHPWGAHGCSTLQIGQTTLPYHEPGHKKTQQHTTINMSRCCPTHQRLWPSLSMATSVMDLYLGAATPYGSEAGASRSVRSRGCQFCRLEHRNRAHKK